MSNAFVTARSISLDSLNIHYILHNVQVIQSGNFANTVYFKTTPWESSVEMTVTMMSFCVHQWVS